jgi:cbb3-type cytochrome oxidase subunit 1
MNKTAANFMKAGVVYALAGSVIGLAMAASHEFSLRSVHTHLNLIGWASMAIFAMYYQLVPQAARSGLARVHFWLANIGLVFLTVSIALLSMQVGAAEPGAALGSIASVGSLLLFAYIVFRTPGEAVQGR